MRNQALIPTAVAFIASVAHARSPSTILDDDKHLLAGQGPYTWECNAPPGKFNQVHTPTVGTHAQVTGILHVVTMHPVPSYRESVTMIGFYDRKAEQGVGLLLMVNYFPNDKIWFWINGDTKLDAKVANFTTQPNTETDFPFTLKLPAGIVSISVAGKDVMSVHTEQGLNGLTFGCSNSHVRFSNVTVTTDAPTSP